MTQASTASSSWQQDDAPVSVWSTLLSSPILWGELLLFACDGQDVQYLIALDKKSGRTVWKTDRSADFRDTVLKNVSFEQYGYQKADWDRIEAIK